MEDEEDETISRIIRDLESSTTIPHSTLLHLQSHLDSSSGFFSNSLQSLTTLVASTMDSATSSNLSILASNLYLSLLLRPNSPVFTLFTPMAFLSLLRSIRRSLKPHHQQPAKSNNKNKKRKNKNHRAPRNSDDGVGGEEGEFDVKVLFSVMQRLELVLDLVHFSWFPDSLKALVQTFAEIPNLGLEMFGNSTGYIKLTDSCSRILSKLLRPEHGDPEHNAAQVLKAVTPLILAANKSPVRSFALNFVTCRIMRAGEENDGVKKAVINLPKYLVQKAPEKAEPRGLAVEAIMKIVKKMEFDDRLRFVEYVMKMTQGKPSLRLLGVDIILTLMMSMEDPFGADLDMESEMGSSWGSNCLEGLIQRCSDSVAGIRARALSNLAQLIGFLSQYERNRVVLKKVMGFYNVDGERSEGDKMKELLRKRCMDEKAAVRKSALLLCTKLTALSGGSFDGSVLKTMGMACSDPLISIRKAAVSALSEAFRTFSDELVIIEWLHSIPRLVTDNESSIQEESEKLFVELVLDRISRVGSACSWQNGSNSSDSNLKTKTLEKEIELIFPEAVLLLLREICNGEVMPWVKKICASLGKKKQLKPKIAHALQSIIRTSESLWLSHSKPIAKWTAPAGAWFLLSEVSRYLSKAVDWEFLHHHWQLLDKCGSGDHLKSPPTDGNLFQEDNGLQSNSVAWAGDRVFLLQTISNVSVELPPQPAAELADNLLKRIEEFNMHPTEVNAHVKALRTLCKRKASDPEEADSLVIKWVQQVLSIASEILQNFISKDSEGSRGSSFCTPHRSRSRKGEEVTSKSSLLSEAVTAVYTIGSLVVVCPSMSTSTIIPVLHTIITSGNSDSKLEKLPGPTISLKRTAAPLYVQSWLTMGKICLADEKLAKRYIPLFVQELEKSDSAALRNNLVVMMSDFCVRYTALVDCYISKITKCLRDPCELVRRQTFILLSRLLQRDYVKWRGVLFLRFLLSLVDESEKIRQLADFLFGNILKVKAPLLAYNSFVEAVFVLNDFNPHLGHTHSKDSRTESWLFSIRGNDESSRSKRMHIYVSLLKQMAPQHLLATFAKICAEILAAASDGLLKIEDVAVQSVLQDAFQILSCKEIRLSPSRGSAPDTADEEESGDNAASAAAAEGRALTQAVRKGLIQNTIPIFIELKRLLESKNSPLIGSLMECLRILLKDYKNEIDDMLIADKQLQRELIYDMQKYEAARVKATANEAVASMQNPNEYRSPTVSKTAIRTQSHNLPDEQLASAMADAAAEATARSVLRDVNMGASTPALGSLNVPKLKTAQRDSCGPSNRPSKNVIESLRRKPSFSDDEN